MKVIAEIDAAHEEIQALRRHIHAHPELRYEETQTSNLIAKTLSDWGVEVHRGIGKTGVVGILRAGSSTRAIGLRADMDALPIQELNTFSHRSQHAGKMHACGHDGHIAMLLGAARYLAKFRDFNGTVVLIFQPAEEDSAGAKAMIEDGLFTKFPVDAVFGLHNWPSLAAGTFGVRPGPIMASSNEFHIRVKGTGAHAALPHKGYDPIFTGAQIINALQGVITRNKKPLDIAVLSITQFHAGNATNVIPGHAVIAGTVRTFDVDTLDLIENRMRAIIQATALAQNCEAEFDFIRNYPPTVNTVNETQFAAEVMQSIVGVQNVDSNIEPTMGAEDFSFMLQARPGCYGFIGNGQEEHRTAEHGIGPCELHSASYDFNDALLGIGATYWVELAHRWLGAQP